MKTRVYIDGYNLYYGCLKGTPYKWLDLVKLFSEFILPSSAPKDTCLADLSIQFFTADIVEKAANSSDSVRDQKSYHRALESLNDQLQIIKGYYSVKTTSAFQVDIKNPLKYPKDCERISIWKLEEKQSDVNLAVEAIYDALTHKDLKQIVFVTNDTDLVPALKWKTQQMLALA